jgi:manganese/iron transport system permease protein
MQEFFLSYEFMQRACVMALLSGLTCGIIGVFVVLLRMSFMGMCISHAAFAGALTTLWLGIPSLLGGFVGGVGAAAIVGPFSDRLRVSADTVVGVIFSVMMSLSMLVLGMLPSARTEGLNFMWGNLLTANNLDIALMAACALGLISFIWVFFKEIQAMISQKQAAIASGVPAQGLYYLTLMMMGVIIAVSLKAVGGILIYALIVTPAATAMQQTYRLKTLFWLAALWGVLSSIFGLMASYWFDIPTGAAIVLAATLFLVVTRLCVSAKGR